MYFFRSDVVFVKRMTFAFEALYGRAGQGREGMEDDYAKKSIL